MITSHGLHPFSKWAISEEGTEGRSGEVLAQSQIRTKIAESPIVNAVILDFAIIVHMLPTKPGHIGRVLQ